MLKDKVFGYYCCAVCVAAGIKARAEINGGARKGGAGAKG